MCIFDQPSAPAIPPATPPPDPVDTTNAGNVAATTAAARKKAALATGIGSTIMTSPLGDQTTATTKKPSLMGGGS